MAKTSTLYIHFDRIRAKGPDAAIVIKLMMACNDMSLANQALADWKRPQASDRKDRQVSAQMYFVRIELGHLWEALKIVKEISDNSRLSELVRQCDFRTRQSFEMLQTYQKGGSEHNRLEQLVGQIRNNLAFHYQQCDKLIHRAVEDRASRTESNLTSITRASIAQRWRFSMADDIVGSIVVRQIWKIPRHADLQIETDKIADEIHSIMLQFLDFSGEFIWKYVDA